MNTLVKQLFVEEGKGGVMLGLQGNQTEHIKNVHTVFHT